MNGHHHAVPITSASPPSSNTGPKSTAPRVLNMIVGPTEYDSAVLSKLGEDSIPQAAPLFIEEMGACLDALCSVLHAPTATPFILSGSGSLGWDLIAANLCEPHDHALVLHTGYFSDSFITCLTAYSVTPHSLPSPIGDAPSLAAVEAFLLSHPTLKLITFTQVDTSTGVLTDVSALCRLTRRLLPHCLIAVDGVCSLGAERFLFDEWGVDAVMSCSQKALGAPPGLTLLLLSPRATASLTTRRTPIPAYYHNLTHWLPVMLGYRARHGGYFATPAVNLVRAMLVSLQAIQAYGVERRWADHRRQSRAVKAAVAALGLKQVVVREEVGANTLTACWYPEGVEGRVVLGKAAEEGVWLSGGLHREIAGKYFRIGHMGISVSPWGEGGEMAGVHKEDVELALKALEAGLTAAGYQFKQGAGVAAYHRELQRFTDEGQTVTESDQA